MTIINVICHLAFHTYIFTASWPADEHSNTTNAFFRDKAWRDYATWMWRGTISNRVLYVLRSSSLFLPVPYCVPIISPQASTSCSPPSPQLQVHLLLEIITSSSAVVYRSASITCVIGRCAQPPFGMNMSRMALSPIPRSNSTARRSAISGGPKNARTALVPSVYRLLRRICCAYDSSYGHYGQERFSDRAVALKFGFSARQGRH